MANQEITITGNIAKQPVFKSGEHNLVEVLIVSDEIKRGESGEYEVREGSQNLYAVTIWGGDNPSSLDQIKVLAKGMRVTVSGAFKPSVYSDDSGTAKLGLQINCSPSDVALKLNRIEKIVMKPKRDQSANQDPNQAAFQQNNQAHQSFSDDDEPF